MGIRVSPQEFISTLILDNICMIVEPRWTKTKKRKTQTEGYRSTYVQQNSWSFVQCRNRFTQSVQYRHLYLLNYFLLYCRVSIRVYFFDRNIAICFMVHHERVKKIQFQASVKSKINDSGVKKAVGFLSGKPVRYNRDVYS